MGASRLVTPSFVASNTKPLVDWLIHVLSHVSPALSSNASLASLTEWTNGVSRMLPTICLVVRIPWSDVPCSCSVRQQARSKKRGVVIVNHDFQCSFLTRVNEAIFTILFCYKLNLRLALHKIHDLATTEQTKLGATASTGCS